MGLQKTFSMYDGINDNNVTGDYIKLYSIKYPDFDINSGWSNGTITFFVYKDKESRDTNKQPIKTIIVSQPIEFFSNIPCDTITNAVKYVYENKGKIEELSDAEDLI